MASVEGVDTLLRCHAFLRLLAMGSILFGDDMSQPAGHGGEHRLQRHARSDRR